MSNTDAYAEASAPFTDDIEALPPTYSTVVNETDQTKKPFLEDVENITPPTNLLNKEEKLRNIMNKHEISSDFTQRLLQLQDFKVVFIFDDSGSMNRTLNDSPLNSANSLLKAKRWDELEYFAKLSFEIATIFDPEGCSFYFLNKKPSPIHNITDEEQITQLFKIVPKGLTPLTRVLKEVLRDNQPDHSERKLLIVIVTDGEPSEDNGNDGKAAFKEALLSRSKNVYTSIVACTDDDEEVEYLNKLDTEIPNLGIVNDFRNERAEIKKIKGANFHFTFGDYVVKSLIGQKNRQSLNYQEAVNSNNQIVYPNNQIVYPNNQIVYPNNQIVYPNNQNVNSNNWNVMEDGTEAIGCFLCPTNRPRNTKDYILSNLNNFVILIIFIGMAIFLLCWLIRAIVKALF